MSIALIFSVYISGCSMHTVKSTATNDVSLKLFRPFADCVDFYSSDTGFSPRRAEKTIWGNWVVHVPDSKEFKYFYVVDGKVVLPDCAFKEQDDFGRFNCVYTISL
ncbi:hypothetical protein [Desulfosediminicola flagellatus]|uniref:hypothetical protein n=1 Tax=Desulfosediminicola flagellatus TaxID=2569541 RepID=UPI0010AC4BE4|nr:hypothetical protein [Desulfosediminicola flagellatus]